MSVAHQVDVPVRRRMALAEMTALHWMMNVQIQRLEAELDELPPGRLPSLLSVYVRSALALRDLLVRLSGLPNMIPRDLRSFDHVLADAALRAYRWALVQLVEIRPLLGAREPQGVKCIPLEALSVFRDLAELSAHREHADERQLVSLQTIDDALYCLIETRHHIEEILVPQLPTIGSVTSRHCTCP